MGQAQDFIRDLCEVFGFSHKRLVSFEQRVKKLGDGRGRMGCGNFLVITCRQIRCLEREAAEALMAIAQKTRLVTAARDAKQFGQIQCDVHPCHGIEIEASAAHIATVALWLTDHQENLRASRALGGNVSRLPLDKQANPAVRVAFVSTNSISQSE